MPLQIRRTTKRKPRLDKSPGRTFASRPKRLSLKDSPGSDTPHHMQPIQDRHSWFTRGRSAGATAPTILSSRPSATSEAITRSDSAAFESAGRCMMRLVTSCITGKRPQTPAGATLQRAFNGVHADGQSTCASRSQLQRGVHLTQRSTSAILLS